MTPATPAPVQARFVDSQGRAWAAVDGEIVASCSRDNSGGRSVPGTQTDSVTLAEQLTIVAA